MQNLIGAEREEVIKFVNPSHTIRRRLQYCTFFHASCYRQHGGHAASSRLRADIDLDGVEYRGKRSSRSAVFGEQFDMEDGREQEQGEEEEDDDDMETEPVETFEKEGNDCAVMPKQRTGEFLTTIPSLQLYG